MFLSSILRGNETLLKQIFQYKTVDEQMTGLENIRVR